MRSYFVGAVTIAVVIISISTSLVEGRIGGSVEVLRRMLEDEEEAIDDQEEVDECKDSTRGSIPTGVNENLKCKKIKKLDRCEEEYDGNYLYESCLKSCDICEDEFDTTEAPTGNLLDIEFDTYGDIIDPLFTDLPTESPSVYPTVAITDAPTELPSAYPTIAPTTLPPTIIALLEVSEEPTSEAILDIDFLSEKFKHDGIESLLFDEDDEDSAPPTMSPIAPFTDAPTESPSAYPTTPLDVNEFEDLKGDELLAALEGI